MGRPSNWHFNILAPIYDWLAGPCMNRSWDLLLEKLDPSEGDLILDLGGGTGQLEREIDDRFPNKSINVVTLDYNLNMLKQGKSKRDSFYVRGDAINMPFEDHQFDRVFIGDALHHMADPDKVFVEVQRVLGADGYLLVEEFNPTKLTGRILYYIEKLSAMGSTFYTPETLSRMISESGLRLQGHWDDGFTYYVRATRF